MSAEIMEKDLKILGRLRANSRESLTIMSKKTGIPISTIFDRIRQQLYVNSFTVLLNFQRLGLHTHALVFLAVKKEEKDRLRKHLLLHPAVNSLYKINNEFDFVLEVLFSNIRELDKFLENVEDYGVTNKHIHYLVDELRREGVLNA